MRCEEFVDIDEDFVCGDMEWIISLQGSQEKNIGKRPEIQDEKINSMSLNFKGTMLFFFFCCLFASREGAK
ncbi:hypothetical protein CEXT_373171 [Caerostris extrusa]|uniref:MATH domain-containing protein n=1 Tax=Caerostris extrusa TaxID=172846 RepID=A0AAV4UBL5_CAEEX|nr:hypothetical protein CEXT_373171 [Caerostris extrusa]